MLNGRPLIKMDRRNVVFSLVQDRSKLQTFTPTIFKMSAQQQQQSTAEKSVQTQEIPNQTTLVLTNNSLAHLHAENATTEVAKTLVSLANGQQILTNTNKTPTVINVSTSNSLPILSLADYTTAQGVPTAMALATQAKISPVKHEKVFSNVDDDDDHDDISMSADEYVSSNTDAVTSSETFNKTGRAKVNQSSSTSKGNRKSMNEVLQYGPIIVKPRKSTAPTLASGRKSKDEPLPPDEDQKRKQRRDRNKQAAAKCRRKRNELREVLEKRADELIEEQNNLERKVQSLLQRKSELENLIQQQNVAKRLRLSVGPNNMNSVNQTKNEVKSNPTSVLFDPNGNGRRMTINITNPQDLFTIPSLGRVASVLTTTGTVDGSSAGGSSTMPMITIHIIPEMSPALLGATSIDKTKLAELLQQSNASNTAQMMTNSISDSNIGNSDSTANSSS